MIFYRSLFVLLYVFFWPLCCLFFFDIWILVTPFGIFKLFLVVLASNRVDHWFEHWSDWWEQITRTPLKTGSELRCSGRVSSHWSTIDIRRVNIVTNAITSHVPLSKVVVITWKVLWSPPRLGWPLWNTSICVTNDHGCVPLVVNTHWSTIDIRRVNIVTNAITSHEWGKDWEVFTTSGTHPWSFVTQILVFHNGQPSRGGDHKTFQVMTTTLNGWFHRWILLSRRLTLEENHEFFLCVLA
jgi:hypothetical protein